LATVKFRARTIALVEHRWIAITMTQLVSHLSLYLVLLVTLRDVGEQRQGRLGGGPGHVRVRASGHCDPIHPLADLASSRWY